jgi:diacylglycerol kinase (ATP)
VSHSFCLVVNPAAGGGRGERHLPEALGALAADAAPAVRVCPTTSLGHAVRLAEQATARQETVVAVGGDGLVGAVAGAVSRAGGLLAIIPAGRGNDFARMLGVPARPAAAARALLSGEPRAVDLIGVQSGDGPELVVAGSVYLGVPSEGGEIANRSWWARGPVGYQLAGVRALLGWRPATFTVDPGPMGTRVVGPAVVDPAIVDPAVVDPAAAGWSAVSFPGFCVVVANSVYLAAGKKVAPDADIGDGLLDVIMVGQGGKLSFAEAMLRAGRGTHVRMDQVTTQRAACVTVTADRAMPAAADGETLACACPLGAGSPLRIRALPGALRVIAPAGGPAAGQRRQSPERTWWPRPPPRKDSTNSGLEDSSAGVPSIRTSPPPST